MSKFHLKIVNEDPIIYEYPITAQQILPRLHRYLGWAARVEDEVHGGRDLRVKGQGGRQGRAEIDEQYAFHLATSQQFH